MRLAQTSAALSAVFLLAASAPALAASFTTSAQFGPAPTDYNGSGLGASSLALFDTSLGTLTSIDITSSYGFNSNIVVFNQGQSDSNGTVRTESAASFRSTSSGVDDVLQAEIDQLGDVTVGGLDINPAAFDLLGRTRTYSLAPGAAQTVSSAASTQTFDSGLLTDSAILSDFSSSGASDAIVQLFTGTGLLLANSGGNSSASQQTNATGTLQVTYNYTPETTVSAAPEPGVWALMLAGVAMIGLTLRQGRRQRGMALTA